MVLYGVYSVHESFCLLDEMEARHLAAEVAEIQAVTTLGGLRSVAPSIRYTWLPADLDEFEDEPDDTPWHWEQDGEGVADGDWPPMPTAYALEAFADEEIIDDVIEATGAHVVTTTFIGDYLYIPITAERELVDALARHGVRAVRDDGIIDAMGVH